MAVTIKSQTPLANGEQTTEASVPIGGEALVITLQHSAQMSLQVIELIAGTVAKGVFIIGKHVIEGINYLANELIQTVRVAWHLGRVQTMIAMIEITSERFGAALSRLDKNKDTPQEVKDAVYQTLISGMQFELDRIRTKFNN